MNFYQNKKVLVTGGGGFVGSHLVEALDKLGAIVTVPTRHSQNRFLETVKNKIKLTKVDLTDKKAVDKVVSGQDLVFHLAAHLGGISYNIAHPARMMYKNLLPALNVIEAASQAGVKRMLVTSSACVYPRFCTIPTPETEGFKDEPEPTNTGYGWSKRVAEILARTYHQEYGLPIAIVRPYNAYGPRDNFDPEQSHVIPGLVKRVCDGENPLVVWGDGSPTRAFIYVTDIVRGMLLALEKYPKPDPINLGTTEEISIKELAQKIIKLSGKKTALKFDTAKPNGQPKRNCDTAKAKKILGFEAKVTLDQGLPEVIKYYRERK